MVGKLKRPVLRYHGGKWILAPWIISHFPKHQNYTEVFGGGGSVLIRKYKSHAEVYNDKWDTVVNVFTGAQRPEIIGTRKKQISEKSATYIDPGPVAKVSLKNLNF